MSIDIRKVSFTYSKDSINEHHALKDISLFFEDHSFIGIVEKQVLENPLLSNI